ncbi:MAG: glycine betaine ABC transporter substrate-binding protein [Candidatus Limnocylindrales bacterium]
MDLRGRRPEPDPGRLFERRRQHRGTSGERCSPSAGGAATEAPSASSTGEKGTVKIAINPWVGAEANVAVVKNLLEAKLGYKVEATSLAEEVAWPGFETGEIDAIIENWGHPDLEKKYITDAKVAQDVGLNGVNGIIGWYVPEWMVAKYPDITDWNNLNKYADLFKTSESGGKGQFLASDPTFVTNDEALITNLKLNFKAVYSGSEAATITAFQQATEQQTPLIGYFYDPQWLHSKIEAGPGQAAAVHGRLRRRCQGRRLRLSPLQAQQDRRHEVRERGRRCVHAREELLLDERGPEPRRGLHHERRDDRGRSRCEVGRGQRGRLVQVDAVIAEHPRT